MRTALIVSATVLVTASTATAAFVVTSKDIKNGTIQPIDLSAQTKRALRGSIGPRGPRGPEGPKGPRGVQGERGLVGVERTYGFQADVAPGDTETSTAICPSGVAVGGGFFAPNTTTGLVAVDSRAYNDTVWIVRMKNLGSFTDSFSAQVICAH